MGSVQRVAMELIREKERANTRAVELLCPRAIASVLFSLTLFLSVPNDWLPPDFMLERQHSV